MCSEFKLIQCCKCQWSSPLGQTLCYGVESTKTEKERSQMIRTILHIFQVIYVKN